MRIQSIALEYHGNVPVLGCHIIYQTVSNVKLSIGYFLQTGNHTKRGRFSTSGRSYQHNKLFIFNFQIKIWNYHITFIIYFLYMLKCNICHLFFLLILLKPLLHFLSSQDQMEAAHALPPVLPPVPRPCRRAESPCSCLRSVLCPDESWSAWE